ncbi:MAG: DJ-1/PfpI family protein [Burkholderiaceae bacterium]|nr:DJ-1/PfpI family protein [Burkholderiaceae bacterium]
MNVHTPVRLVFLVFEGMNLLDLSGPLQALATTNRLRPVGVSLRYETFVASAHGGSVTSNAGLPVMTIALAALDGLPIDTLIVAGGSLTESFHAEPALVDWVARSASSIRRVCSVCTGAFLLAAAGQLTGRRVATHWDWASRLQALYPAIQVDPDPLYIHDGKVWTSAGVTAGIDMTLALIEEDCGHPTAMQTARHLVMHLKRSAGQTQISALMSAQVHDRGTFSELHAWIALHLVEDLGVERLAEKMKMSPRNFARTYVAKVGRTPAKVVESIRIEAALHAMETTALPLKSIAASVGLVDEQNLRRAFIRHMGLSPNQYRARFSLLANPGYDSHYSIDIGSN